MKIYSLVDVYLHTFVTSRHQVSGHHQARSLYLLYPLDRTLGRPQNRSGLCGEENNFLPPPGIEQFLRVFIL
jgi:hypothetical protein